MTAGNGAGGHFATWSSAGFGSELVRVERGGKKPTEPGWQALEVTDAHLAAWDRRPSNVGLRARFYPALDLDTEDLEVIAAVTDLAGQHFGSTAARGRSNSNRAALLYRLEGQPFEKAKIKFTRNGQAGAVEILAAGQQLVVDGTHPTGAALEWRPSLPAVDWIAPMTRAGRDRFMAALRHRLVELGCEVEGRNVKAPAPTGARALPPRGDDADRARSALDALDPDTDHDSWLRLGMALHSEWPAGGGTGFQLWDAWSARGTKYPGTEELAKRWRSFKPGGGIGLGTIFHDARSAGWRPANVRGPGSADVPATERSGSREPRRSQAASDDEDQEDIRIAARLVERARGRFLWVYRQGGGAWSRWDGHRWVRDDARAIYELAAEVARSFLADAAAVTGDKQKALIAAARKAQQAQRIEWAVRLAASAFPDLKAPASGFDTDDMVLNTLSGLVDLRTGTVRPCRPEDRVTMLAPVEFDPDARHPRFERFLEEVLPNPEVRAYVKRAAGYTTTGSTREHAMFLPVGGGRNGKGVLLRLLLRALGDYGRTAAAGLLLERHGGEAHLTELASLDGARFVFASEVPPRSRWNEPRLKQLVGGDPITARFMRQDEFTFHPRCKVWIAMNERPRVVGTSDAIWARLKEVRFPVQFRDADDPRPEVQRQPVKDTRLEEALLPSALPAVLAWAVAGALEWQRNGLGEPPEVREAVQEYRTAQDNVAPFLAEHPVTEKARLRDLFKAWTAWCAEVQEKPGAQSDLAAALRAKGYEVKLGHGKVTYVYPLKVLILDTEDRGSGGVGTPPNPPYAHGARARNAHTGITPPALPHSPAPDHGKGEA